MKHLEGYQKFVNEEDSYNYEVNFHDDAQNHLVMRNDRKVYGDSFMDGGAANREIDRYLKMGYQVEYYGPDLDYAQEIVD